ncbi:MAG TPA: hypothetical protein VLK65_00080 [Vicinamibacteria bacterium]|nr:hypothetical protein [Vicinamibacteria bacterium]
MLTLVNPLPVPADHGGELPATIEDCVCSFVAALDDVVWEFGFGEGETPSFEDDRLNRSLVKARRYVWMARTRVASSNLASAFRSLRAAVRELEKGGSLVNVSGRGFADDLASLVSARAEFFTEDLLALSAQLQTVSAEGMDEAQRNYAAGVAARDTGEWEISMFFFGKAMRALEGELLLGSLPCF